MAFQTFTFLLMLHVIIVLTGCSAMHSPHDAKIQEQGNIIEIQYVEQLESYSCGAASLEMVSSYWDKTIKQEDLVNSAGKSIMERGFSVGDIKTSAIENGLKAISFGGNRQILEDQISKGRPVITALSLPYNRSVQSPILRKFPASKAAAFFMDAYSHFVVVIGITTQEIIVMDPLTGIDTYSYKEFDKYWKERSYAAILIST